jgi:glycosyltransferase involved in cell wall biosynthesis
MAAYNGAALLPETLTSLCAQTFTDWELVVVDDRSTDDTVAVLRAWPDPRIRVIEASENGGPVRARNLAVSHARGRYLAALDHDDLCRPERFARQVAYLDAHPDVVVVGTAADNLIDGVLSHPDHPPITTPALTEWLLMIGNPLVWSSTMLRGDAVRRLDPFTRPELLYAEDFDLYHRLAPLGRIARLDEVLVAYRIHPGGVSKRFASRMVDGSVAVLEAAHRPLFGDDAGRVAMLFSRHLMLRESVPDRATLAELGAALGRAQAHHLDSREHDADDRRLIRWETARRWARVGRAGLRTGALSVGDLVATRPDHLGLGYAGPGDLLWSRAIGRARTLGAA